MEPPAIDYTKHDRQIWEEELAGFLPERLFDAHIHLLNRAHLSDEKVGWSSADLSTLQQWAAQEALWAVL